MDIHAYDWIGELALTLAWFALLPKAVFSGPVHPPRDVLVH